MIWKVSGLVAAALLLSAGAAVAFVPALRSGASALLNSPSHLPAVATDARVHYEPGAQDCADEVAALLPTAVAVIEAAQLRRFAAGPVVGVYATDAGYSAANGMGKPLPAGVSFNGRLSLAPRLCGAERARLPAILTHELSHVNLQQNLSWLAYVRLPDWFREGLAVSLSKGGGAEGVTEQDARAEIARGVRISVAEGASLVLAPEARFDLRRARLAYRQAGMFLDSLRADREAFDTLLRQIYAGADFASAFRTAYRSTPEVKFAEFVANAALRAAGD